MLYLKIRIYKRCKVEFRNITDEIRISYLSYYEL